jgi:hypothetical protein
MKNRIIIVLIATIINMGVFAQNKGDSLRVMKNEIGINLIPLINYGSQSYNNKAVANVFYKRQLKNNWHGRASVILFSNSTNNYDSPLDIHALPNSKLRIEYTQNNSRPFFQYNFGIEKRFGKGKIKQFTGCDVGYAQYKTENKLLYGVRDSLGNNYPYSQPSFQNQTDSVVSHIRKTSNAVILTPFYGMQFNISKHFFFSAQAGLALSIVNENSKSLINNANSIRITNFDLNISGVSSNFSICYRF